MNIWIAKRNPSQRSPRDPVDHPPPGLRGAHPGRDHLGEGSGDGRSPRPLREPGVVGQRDDVGVTWV